jgi:hypothetical protein
MFIVTVITLDKFYLRGTVWSYAQERASQFATREEAQAALTKAKPFMKAVVFKKTLIEEIA